MPALFAGYQPFDKQLEVHRSKARHVALSAGVRGGKSICESAEFCRRILADVAGGKRHPLAPPDAKPFDRFDRPRLLYWAVGVNYELTTQVRQYVRAFLAPLERAWLPSEQTLWLKNRACIKFKSAEKPDTLVSDGIDGLLTDESARMPAQVWRGALRSRLSDRRGWSIHASTPLTGRASWMWQDLISKAGRDPEIAAFTWRTADNPFIDRSELESARNQLSERYYARDYEASWSSFGASMFEEWNPEIHVVSAKQLCLEYAAQSLEAIRQHRAKRCTAGIDFGWTAPACLLPVLETDRELLVVDEFHEAGMFVVGDYERTLVKSAWDLHRKWNIGEWIYDTEDPQSAAQLRNAGLNLRPANKAVSWGVSKVAALLHPNPQTKRPRLRVLDTCKHTIESMGLAKWKLDRDGNAIEGEKDPSYPAHASDALRYAAVHLKQHEPDGIPQRYAGVGGAPGVGSFPIWRRV